MSPFRLLFMEAGGHGDPGETVREHVVEEFSIPWGNVTTQSQRTAGSTVKASACATGHVTSRTVQIIMVSRNGVKKMCPQRGGWGMEMDNVIISFSFQEKPLERNNVRHTMSSLKLPLEAAQRWSGHPSMLESHQRTGASSSVKPKALATSSFCSPR